MQTALKLLFFACVAAPMIAAIGHSSRRMALGICGIALMLFVLAQTRVDPLAVGSLQVDEALFRGFCGIGLRPSR
ncbi:hypothetical protein [Variovorax sp. PBL-E5]|uniref:hypothetical protein n=1 Tax=Variovorax sp. PBL-E5 TaxID=434014 RepID=UPI0013178C44|nr:hypothetical protein [Variovorax sp. PBL-E5]VTU28870.1 hypothetical protein E5CHR_02696 [Variovorax sp. PBL-E5]